MVWTSPTPAPSPPSTCGIARSRPRLPVNCWIRRRPGKSNTSAGKKLPDLQKSLRRAVTSEQDAKVKLKKAKAQARKQPGKASTQAVKDAQQEVKQAQMLQGFLKDQMPAAESGLRIFQRMAGQ